jgi:hypothetical protein
MTWHEEVVPAVRFLASLEELRRTGATITSCQPCPEGYRVVYVTGDAEASN